MRVSWPPALPAPSLDWREERAASGDKLPARVAPSLPPSPSATDRGDGAVLFTSLHLLLARLSYPSVYSLLSPYSLLSFFWAVVSYFRCLVSNFGLGFCFIVVVGRAG